jgi:hypothetical protein
MVDRTPELVVPDVSWDIVRARVNQFWEARTAPHISVMAQTRAGKSYLMRYGLLPMCRWDRVLILDVKGRDQTLMGLGKPVQQLPTRPQRMKSFFVRPQPMDYWYRLVVHRGPQNIAAARIQVTTAFERVLREGDWVVVIDELRAVTDPQPPGLHLKPYYEEFILRGGSHGIATVSLSQEPRWNPGSFYTQSNFYFFSRLEDEAAQKRLSEVGSAKKMLPIIQKIPRRYWLYMDNMSDTGERFWGKTIVTR